MAKKEAQTDLWVARLLDKEGIEYTAQGSNIKEIDEALKTASKNGKGNVGFPEFVFVSKDFLVVIEDKADVAFHENKDENGVLLDDEKSKVNYAVNGAIHYAQHLAKNTSYRKVIAIGVSGDEKIHKITPIYCDETPTYIVLNDVESFASFNTQNIDEYYTREVLKEETNKEKTTAELLKYAEMLHEDLYTYGKLQTQAKPLVVSGILLALQGTAKNYFDIKSLDGDSNYTDGQKIFNAIENVLKASAVSPQTKLDKILNQFSIIKDSTILNEINSTLGKTPLAHYAEFLQEHIFNSIIYTDSAEDCLGLFYSEFMSYGGGDGQTLGIVLTPKHITSLFMDLLRVDKTDILLDPCTGTAGFLIAGMHKQFNQVKTEKKYTTSQEIERDSEIQNIRKHNLHGYEIQPYMFTIATTNMILRGDGKSNLRNEDFMAQNPATIRASIAPTVGIMNPPYSQGNKKNPQLYEIAFTKQLLDCMTQDGRVAVIVPVSTMTGKTKEEQAIKEQILKEHTLEGVITCNKETFYGVGTHPVIAIFTAGRPHPKNHEVKFINFEDDGYKVAPHIGLIETESAKDKKQHLLDVWENRIEAPSKFCVYTTVEATDEWLHSFYYFNDEIPAEEDFDKTISDYLTFEFSMIMQGREYLFKNNEDDENIINDSADSDEAPNQIISMYNSEFVEEEDDA